MLALTDVGLAFLCIAATRVDPRAREQWLKQTAERDRRRRVPERFSPSKAQLCKVTDAEILRAILRPDRLWPGTAVDQTEDPRRPAAKTRQSTCGRQLAGKATAPAHAAARPRR